VLNRLPQDRLHKLKLLNFTFSPRLGETSAVELRVLRSDFEGEVCDHYQDDLNPDTSPAEQGQTKPDETPTAEIAKNSNESVDQDETSTAEIAKFSNESVDQDETSTAEKVKFSDELVEKDDTSTAEIVKISNDSVDQVGTSTAEKVKMKNKSVDQYKTSTAKKVKISNDSADQDEISTAKRAKISDESVDQESMLWQGHYHALNVYVHQHGHPPQTQEENPILYDWLTRQRERQNQIFSILHFSNGTQAERR